MASTFENITQGITDVFNSIGEILSYINPFSENFILNSVIEFLGNILSYINPFSENFLGKKIIELLSDLLEFLFIPSEERINGLVDSVKSKFSFVDLVKDSIVDIEEVLEGSEGAPSLTIHVKASSHTSEQDLKIIDLSWYVPYKEYGDMILTAFIYAFFIWRIYISLPNIISGVGGSISDISTEIPDIKSYIKGGRR